MNYSRPVVSRHGFALEVGSLVIRTGVMSEDPGSSHYLPREIVRPYRGYISHHDVVGPMSATGAKLINPSWGGVGVLLSGAVFMFFLQAISYSAGFDFQSIYFVAWVGASALALLVAAGTSIQLLRRSS